MNRILFQIYRVLIPKPLRTIIRKKNLREKILNYLGSLPPSEISSEQVQVIDYLKSHELSIFPYPFNGNYSHGAIEVFYDPGKKMRYVLHEGKRLYFKKRWGENRIRRSCTELLREQDTDSPHRYLDHRFSISKDDVIADIGAAEGNFSLSVIEKVKKVYLFERDQEWIEAMKATFAPWPDKVEIVSKYVSDIDNDSHMRIDTFFKNRKDITFLKIDVDGAEEKVLNSCDGVFKSDVPLKIALCTYHKNGDEKDFTSLLQKNGFDVNPSKGYMIHYYDKKLGPPYLRRGLIRAVRG